MQNFVHLHVHSYYSVLDGQSSIAVSYTHLTLPTKA